MSARSPSAGNSGSRPASLFLPNNKANPTAMTAAATNAHQRRIKVMLFLVTACVWLVLFVFRDKSSNGGSDAGAGSPLGKAAGVPTPFPTPKPYVQYRYDPSKDAEAFKKSQVSYFGPSAAAAARSKRTFVDAKTPFGNDPESIKPLEIARPDDYRLDTNTPLQQSVFTTPRKPIRPAYKGIFNHLFQIVEKYSDKVCEAKTVRDRTKGKGKPAPPILPRCPTYADNPADSNVLGAKGDFPFGDGSLTTAAVLNDDGEGGGGLTAYCNRRDNSTWAHLHRAHTDQLSIKVLRLLITNSGCDDILNFDTPNIQTEFFKPIREEYIEEMTILNYGSGCGHGDEFFSEYLAGVSRINIMSIDHRGALVEHAKKTRAPVAREYLSRSHFQPSTINYCHSKQEIEWIPDGTFNAVISHDRLRSVPPSQLCDTVRELLRVTKVGGAVWVGHIDDPQQVTALTECKVPTCDGYNVEVSRILEQRFLPRMGLPDHFVKTLKDPTRKPYSFLWRKETMTFFDDIKDINDVEGRRAGGGNSGGDAPAAVVEDAPPPEMKGGKSIKMNFKL